MIHRTENTESLGFLNPNEQIQILLELVRDTEDAIMITDAPPATARPHILYVNPAFTTITGYTSEDALGQTTDLFYGPRTNGVVVDRLRTCLENGRGFEGETVHYKKDGTPYLSHWTMTPIRNDEEITYWIWVQRDVTTQQKRQHSLLRVQEEERSRIAQEIHQELGGLLTTLQMNLTLVGENLVEQNSGQHLQKAKQLVNEVSRSIRGISRRLLPRVLDNYGLGEALEWLVNELEQHEDLEVDLYSELDDEDEVSPLVQTMVYRIVQEALTNVRRHAQTDGAQVVLNREPNELRIHVIDEGRGFSPSSTSTDGRIGLQGMKERAERFNGSLDVESTPGEGTRVSVTLPL